MISATATASDAATATAPAERSPTADATEGTPAEPPTTPDPAESQTVTPSAATPSPVLPPTAQPTGRPPVTQTVFVPYTRAGNADALIRRVTERTMKMSRLRGGPAGASMDLWDWESGVALAGLMSAYEATGDEDILNFVAEWADAQLATPSLNTNPAQSPPKCAAPDWGRTADRPIGHPNLTTPAWAVYWLHHYRPKPAYLAAADRAVAFMRQDACRVDGILAHVPGQAWDDTLIVSTPLLARYGALQGCPDCLDLAFKEYLGHSLRLRDAKTGLWFHGWDSTGQYPVHLVGAFWARGNAWTLLAATEILRWLDYDADHDGPVERRLAQSEQIRAILGPQLKGIVGLQDAGGLWHTLVNRPDFYLETSGSAGIVAALRRATAAGWVDPTDQATAERLRQAITKGRAAVIAQIAPDGTVRNVSAGTGAVNDDVNRYNGIDRSRIQPYGQGLALMMLSTSNTPLLIDRRE